MRSLIFLSPPVTSDVICTPLMRAFYLLIHKLYSESNHLRVVRINCYHLFQNWKVWVWQLKVSQPRVQTETFFFFFNLTKKFDKSALGNRPLGIDSLHANWTYLEHTFYINFWNLNCKGRHVTRPTRSDFKSNSRLYRSNRLDLLKYNCFYSSP